MADGGRADSIGVVETAARMLAAGYGTGSFLRANVAELGIVSQESRGAVVAVAWRGSREESAAKRIGDSGRASAMHAWTRRAGAVALPSFRTDLVSVAALSGVEAVPAALLRVFALEDWQAWPLVERAIVHAVGVPHAEVAARDAMARILWRTAEVAKAARAKQARMRYASYIELTGRMERILLRWLRIGATQYMDTHKRLTHARKRLPCGPAAHASDPCGFKRETWWRPERKTPVKPQE